MTAEKIAWPGTMPAPQWAFAVLAGCIAVLLAMSLAALLVDRATQRVYAPWLALLGVNSESNLPTWFSVVQLAAAAGLARMAWVDARAWGWLALLFALLSLDEGAMLHETVGRGLVGIVERGGALHYRWVVVGAPLALLTLIGLAWITRPLTPRERARLALAAAVYFGGAVVLEAAGGLVADTHGRRSLAAMLLVHFEEGMEMLGAALAVRALLMRLHGRTGPRPGG